MTSAPPPGGRWSCGWGGVGGRGLGFGVVCVRRGGWMGWGLGCVRAGRGCSQRLSKGGNTLEREHPLPAAAINPAPRGRTPAAGPLPALPPPAHLGMAWGLPIRSGASPSAVHPAPKEPPPPKPLPPPPGDGVRVDYEVRHHPLRGEGHVLHGVGDAHGALLAVAGRKLVAHLGLVWCRGGGGVGAMGSRGIADWGGWVRGPRRAGPGGVRARAGACAAPVAARSPLQAGRQPAPSAEAACTPDGRGEGPHSKPLASHTQTPASQLPPPPPLPPPAPAAHLGDADGAHPHFDKGVALLVLAQQNLSVASGRSGVGWFGRVSGGDPALAPLCAKRAAYHLARPTCGTPARPQTPIPRRPPLPPQPPPTWSTTPASEGRSARDASRRV